MVRLISCHIHLLVDPKPEMTSDTLTSLAVTKMNWKHHWPTFEHCRVFWWAAGRYS